jgi:hypothetical protein
MASATLITTSQLSRLIGLPQQPAISLGNSRMYREDLLQLEAGMALYDAFYRWCRDATGETHNWPSQKPSSRGRR